MAKTEIQIKVQDDCTIIEARIPHRHNGRPNLAAVQAVLDRIDQVNPAGFDPREYFVSEAGALTRPGGIIRVDQPVDVAIYPPPPQAAQQFETAESGPELNVGDRVGINEL